jgi:hypothetical protein
VCSLGDLSPRPPEQWLALARKLEDALTGQMSLPGMADDDPALDRLVKSLPASAASGVVEPTFEVTATSPDDLVGVHFNSERVEKDRAIRIKQEQRFLRDVAKVQARIQNGQLKKEIKIGEAIGRL